VYLYKQIVLGQLTEADFLESQHVAGRKKTMLLR